MRWTSLFRRKSRLLTEEQSQLCQARYEDGAYSKPDSWADYEQLYDYYTMSLSYPAPMNKPEIDDFKRQVEGFELEWLKENHPELLEYNKH